MRLITSIRKPAARAIATASLQPGPAVSSRPVQKCCAEMMSVSVAGIEKNRCRTTVAERMGETLAELPFIGDQIVCLSHDQAARNGSATPSRALVCAGMTRMESSVWFLPRGHAKSNRSGPLELLDLTRNTFNSLGAVYDLKALSAERAQHRIAEFGVESRGVVHVITKAWCQYS